MGAIAGSPRTAASSTSPKLINKHRLKTYPAEPGYPRIGATKVFSKTGTSPWILPGVGAAESWRPHGVRRNKKP